MTKEFTYQKAGVDRELRLESKKALQILKNTYRFSRHGKTVELPFGNIFPTNKRRYLDFVIEGVGTKVLVAQLAEKYDTIGIDGVAMAVNDVIRSGATPLAVVDNIHAQVSDPALTEKLIEGIAKGATEAECIVTGGEIGDVSELIRGLVERKGFDLVVASIGEAKAEEVISGRNLEPGNAIIGLKSSGIHSNGMSLARKILLKKWGGKYEPHETPDGMNREIVYEILEPTKIYVQSLLKAARKVKVKAAVHITGDAYAKFSNLARFSKGIGFEFDTFDPPPVFGLIQKTAKELGGTITLEEMFRTFNMGWGFAIAVDEASKDDALDALETANVQAEQIGRITNSAGTEILYENNRIVLK